MRTSRLGDEMKFQKGPNISSITFGAGGCDVYGRTVMDVIIYERSVERIERDWAKARLADINKARGTWHLYREPISGARIAIKTPRPVLECRLLADHIDGLGMPHEHLGRIPRPRKSLKQFYTISDSDRVPIGCAERWAVRLGVCRK